MHKQFALVRKAMAMLQGWWYGYGSTINANLIEGENSFFFHSFIRVLLGAPNIIVGAPNIFLKYQNYPCAFFAFVMGVYEGGP